MPAPHLACGSSGFTTTRTAGAGALIRAFARAFDNDFTRDIDLAVVFLASFGFVALFVLATFAAVFFLGDRLPGDLSTAFLPELSLEAEPDSVPDFLLEFLLAFTLRTPLTTALFLTFATSAPRLCNGRRVVSGSFRYGNLGVVVTYVNTSAA